MKLSASKVLGDRSFSKMERAVSHEGDLIIDWKLLEVVLLECFGNIKL